MSEIRRQDYQAIQGLADRLKVPVGSLGGLMELESNIRPNVWGGAGGKYRGLIQFGPGARSEVGLPDRDMTIEEQIPYVEKYFNQRGFTPGKHGVTEMYRTVLVGNPGQSGTDSFGTNSDKAAARMQEGGDLYARAMERFKPHLGQGGATAQPAAAASTPATGGGGAAIGSGSAQGAIAGLQELLASQGRLLGGLANLTGSDVSSRSRDRGMGLDIMGPDTGSRKAGSPGFMDRVNEAARHMINSIGGLIS